jgi:isomerase DpgB
MERLNMNIEDTASISVELIEKINQLCAQAEADEQVKVVGFTFGKTSGADAGEAIADVALLHKWEKSLRRLENVNALIVAHCEGELSLAAMSILAVSDLRIGTPASSFGLNGKEVTVPGMLIHRLTQQLNANGLRSLLLLGNRWSAEEAEANGLLDRVASQPQALTEDIIFGLNPHAFNDIRVRRKLILEASTASYDETLGLSLSASDRIMRKG